MARLYPTERLAALNDGVAAVAVTLLVLDLELPPHGGAGSSLLSGLVSLLPRLELWLASFLACGTLWVLQSALLSAQEHVRMPTVAAALVHMAAVSLLPFSVTVVADYPDNTYALLWFWANVQVAILGSFGGVFALLGLPEAQRSWAYRDTALLRATLMTVAFALVVPMFCAVLALLHPRLSLWGWLPGAVVVWSFLPPGTPEDVLQTET